MWSFVIDEDMPRSTAPVLRAAGYVASDVRDIGLTGHKDPEIFARAQSLDATLITADLEFANLLLFPLGTHAGIIVMRSPNLISPRRLNELLLAALQSLDGESLHGLLVIVDLARTRVRRPSPS